MKIVLPLLLACSLLSAATAAPIHVKGDAPLRIAHGATIDLADYVVPGKTTVFDFTSEYCPPCRGYDEPLRLLHAKNPGVAIVQVDINRPETKRIDWQSPVARQFGLQSIPHFKVYGPDGKLVAEDKLVFGADGRPDRALSRSDARAIVDRLIAEAGR